MNRLIAIITGLHVLAHGIFGCCGHHSHHLSARAAVSHCCAPSGGDDCSQHHESGHQHESSTLESLEVAQADGNCFLCQSESSPRQPHQCSHASCQWLASGASGALAFIALDHGPAFCTPALLTATFAAGTARCSENEERQFFALPVRLHLAVGVLLI